MTEADILHALRERFPEEAYAFLPQVRNGTGFVRHARTADAMVMSLWPSRGLVLSGFEIKISRADWLREIKKPQKAEDIFSYCDHWWLVAADQSIVKEGELPATWGLMVMRNNRIVINAAAPKLDPKPLDRLMLAAMLRNAQAHSTDNAILAKEKGAAFHRGYTEGSKTSEVYKKQLNDLEMAIRTFEQASGISIRHEWDHAEIGKAVRVVRDGGLLRGRDRIVQLMESAMRIADDAKNELAIIDSACAQYNQPVSNQCQSN